MGVEQRLAVIFQNEKKEKRLVIVRNLEELNRLNSYCIIEYTRIDCYVVGDISILKEEDINFKNLLENNKDLNIPYFIIEKDYKLNDITFFKNRKFPININEDKPLLKEIYRLKHGRFHITYTSLGEIKHYFESFTLNNQKLIRNRRN